MNELQRELLIGYLRDKEVDILSINFLKGGNISEDTLSVNYYRKEKSQKFLTTDVITPSGEVKRSSIKSVT